jgi:hypothetical protein
VSDGAEARSTPNDPGCCPVCGGALLTIKCKIVCDRCKALISNCNGD